MDRLWSHLRIRHAPQEIPEEPSLLPPDHAAALVAHGRAVLDRAVAAARASVADRRADEFDQVVGYDLAATAGRIEAADALRGSAADAATSDLALVYAGAVCSALEGCIAGRSTAWGHPPSVDDDGSGEALAAARDPAFVAAVGDRVVASGVPRHLDDELSMVQTTFSDYAQTRIAPEAGRIHREDADVPDWLIDELAGMGCFGLSIPESYGGAVPDSGDRGQALRSMLVVTEELSRGSLGAAGSLITRPEMLAGALLSGGTDEQRRRWLPAIAAGEKMCAIAVTEPDHGSDVANLRMRAERHGDDYLLSGTKTWCTFAGRAELIMLLARTGAAEDGHRGLTAFVVEKPRHAGHAWEHGQRSGGRLQARAIPTIGYRGMHSFELSSDRYRVPGANVIGGEDGIHRGFYLQMGAFATGRLQTAARAVGVMQAALDTAAGYARERVVFGAPLATYPLSRAKFALMGAHVAAARALAHLAARRYGETDGGTYAALSKSVACAAAESVTREAQQLHGGMGYAEEYDVSRYFVDARVLPIFEGADEVLALKVILRSLLS